MAIVTNTFQSTSAVGNREELSDVVNRITPEDSPIYSLIGSTSCKTTHPEWEYEELDAPAANIQLEGDEYDFTALVPATRVGNYTQILRKDWIVSNTQNTMDNAGDAEKGLKKQKLRKGIALRKDVEFSIVSNTASTTTTTRTSGGLPTWLETNTSRGAAGGADGGFNSGDGLTDVAVDGTQRAFTKVLLDGTMQSAYEAGANVKHIVCSPYLKSVFVSFMSDSNVASFRYAAAGGSDNTIIATADVYEGPYGKVMIAPNRVQSTAATSRNAFLIDPDLMEWKWFRKIKEDTGIAKTGDANKKVLIGEGTLCVKNEAAHGVVADCFGLTAGT